MLQLTPEAADSSCVVNLVRVNIVFDWDVSNTDFLKQRDASTLLYSIPLGWSKKTTRNCTGN